MKVLAVAGNTPISNQALSILHAHEEVLVQPVGGAAEALVWLKDQEADILLLLPPFPDTATQPDLRTIRERYPHLPCLTARSQEAPVLSCDTGGMASIILTQEKLDNLPLYLKEVITSEHRKRIQKELYLREQLLWTLSSLTPVLLGEFDLDALLQHIVDEAVRLIPRAQAGSLLLLEGDAFVFRGVSGYDARLKSTRLPINANFMPSLRHGQVTQIQGISYHNSEPLAPETYVALKRYGRIREIEKTLMAPLLLDRQLIGYLTIDSFVEGAIFTPEDEETLRYLTTLATIAIHNAELFTDEHSARMLAETLQEIGTALTSTLEVDKVLDHLLEALRQLIPCDAANVMLANDEEAYITRWQGYSQLQPADLEALRLPLHSTRDLHLAAQERRIIRISDIRTYEGWVDIPESAWIRAHISVPIFLNETLVGFFNLDSATPDAFTEADEKVLTSLIPLATIALRNAQLFQSELKARALAETLQGIGTELTRTLDEAEVIQTVVKRIPNLLPFRTVIITFINGNRMSGTPYIYIQGLPPELEEKIRAVTTDEAFPLIEGVIQTQQGAVLSDARTDPHWTFAPGKENDVPISVLLAPLRSQNQVIGVLILMMDQLDFYTSEHLSTLQALADLLVVALTNARNYMEARQRAENLAALRELGLQISALQDPGAIIHRATASALALTHAAGAVFFRYDSATETFDQTEVAGVPVLPSDYRLSPGEGATGRAWVQQEPVLAQDYRTWEGRIETVGTVHALVSLPVTWQAERMGVLTLFHEDPNATFSPSDISFLQLLIQQVSANLYGADLFQALRRDRDRLAALAEIDQKIVAIADTSEEALRVILHYAVELLGLHKGLIALANEQPSQVLTLYTEGLKHTPDIQQRLLENWHHERAFYESRGPRSYVTIEDHAGAIFPILIVQEHIASALTIPLWIEGEVKGILSLMDDLPHGWGEQEIGLSLMLAQQISIALQKAMMAQEIRQRLEDAEILNRILKSVNATLNPQTILQTVCKELRSYLQVPLVQVNLYQEGDLSTTYEDMEPGYPDARSDFKCIWETSARQYLLKGQAAQQAVNFEPESGKTAAIYPQRPMHSLFLVPLMLREQILGLLVVEPPTAHTFSPREIALVEAVAAAITPALENSRLHREAQEARARAEEAYENLQRLDAMKSQFVQNVTHELRTPLALVKGYTDLLLDESAGISQKLDPALQQPLRSIQTHTLKLTELVESITTLDSMDTADLECQPQAIIPVLRRAAQSIEQKALRQNLELIIDLPDELPEVSLDPPRLGLALMHLLDNAVKFNKPNGKIWLLARQEEESICCSVKDEGIGIPLEEHHHVFERFYQVDGSAKRRYGGMGMGLAVAQEIIEKHGGHIRIESAGLDQGTTVTVILPIYYPAKES